MNPSYFTGATFDIHLSISLVGTNLNQLETQTKLFQIFQSNKELFKDALELETKRHLNNFGDVKCEYFSREQISILNITNIEMDNFKSSRFFSPTHRTRNVSYEMVGDENDDKYIPDPREDKQKITDELDSEGFLKIYYIEGEVYYKNVNDKTFIPFTKL